MTKKVCSKCGKIKNTAKFYKNSIAMDGLRPDCKQCFKIPAIKKYNKDLKAGKRLCTRCNVRKKLSKFYPQTNKSNGRTWCKKCCAEYSKKYQQLYIKEIKQRHKRWYSKNKKKNAEYNKVSRERLKENPIKYKAYTLAGHLIRMGRGKVAYLVDLLNKKIGTDCKYCGEILTLKNIGLDHKTPVTQKEKKDKNYYDKKSNLQLICKKCNLLKSDFTHQEFSQLIFILKDFQILKVKLWKRLTRSNWFWGKRK